MRLDYSLCCAVVLWGWVTRASITLCAGVPSFSGSTSDQVPWELSVPRMLIELTFNIVWDRWLSGESKPLVTTSVYCVIID